MKQKYLVTHIKPHIDDTAAIWLYKKYVPGWKDAKLVFRRLNSGGGEIFGKAVDQDKNIVHLGMGRGKFDEHKHEMEDSCATLVWKFIKRKGYAPKDRYVKKALDRILEFILNEDKGRYRPLALRDFTIDALVHDAMLQKKGDPQKVSAEMYDLGTKLLELCLTNQTNKAKQSEAFDRGIKFNTKWGKAVALKSEFYAFDDLMMGKGYILAIYLNPKTGYKQFRSHFKSKVNLTDAYNRLQKIEPKAGWYLHQSKKLLICGAELAPSVKLSKLNLKQLISVLK